MKSPKHSLRKIVKYLNNPDEDGGFWLPNIQRPFVWSEEQIYRLYDSILREYPISTLLIWKTNSEIRHRKFIDNYREGIKLTDFFVPINGKKKCLVLDGQQRLQSLFIGLCGSYEGKELYFDILSGSAAAPDDIKYKFAFLNETSASFPFIKFKELVFSKHDPLTAAEMIIDSAQRPLSDDERKKISRHVGIVFKTFHSDDGVSYQELDSIESPELYSEDDVVEVFIRANSGGTRLGKSDLLFSLLNTKWEFADEEMEGLLSELNQTGFGFTRDFILKTCLSLLDQGSRYEVYKFRKSGVRESIEDKWEVISNSIKDTLDLIRSKTFIRSDRALASYNALIPIIYARYHYPQDWREAQGIDSYLIRALITGAFSGTPDQMIDDCVMRIRKKGGFSVDVLFEAIRSRGRSLELSEDRLWQMGYNSDNIHLLFNIWYKDFDYTPTYINNYPQIDHIFPQGELKKIKIRSPETGHLSIIKYKQDVRDQLANCMLLKQIENGPAGKSDKLPNIWFADKSDKYLEMHLIPKDKSLWEIDRFEEFIEERKKLIRENFKYLLVTKTEANEPANG